MDNDDRAICCPNLENICFRPTCNCDSETDDEYRDNEEKWHLIADEIFKSSFEIKSISVDVPNFAFCSLMYEDSI